jgi:DnaJ family protein C protein 11
MQEVRHNSLPSFYPNRWQVQDHLSRMKGELLRHRQSNVLLPKGTLQCVVDATSLFQNSSRHGSTWDRVTGVRFSDYTLRHDVQVGIQF